MIERVAERFGLREYDKERDIQRGSALYVDYGKREIQARYFGRVIGSVRVECFSGEDEEYWDEIVEEFLLRMSRGP